MCDQLPLSVLILNSIIETIQLPYLETQHNVMHTQNRRTCVHAYILCTYTHGKRSSEDQTVLLTVLAASTKTVCTYVWIAT